MTCISHMNFEDPESLFDMPSEASAGSWSHLICGGPNGLLLVVLALAWWMTSSTGSNSSPTKEAALDVTWVLVQLRLALDVPNKGKKRDYEIEPGDDLRSSKRYLILYHSNVNKNL